MERYAQSRMVLLFKQGELPPVIPRLGQFNIIYSLSPSLFNAQVLNIHISTKIIALKSKYLRLFS